MTLSAREIVESVRVRIDKAGRDVEPRSIDHALRFYAPHCVTDKYDSISPDTNISNSWLSSGTIQQFATCDKQVDALRGSRVAGVSLRCQAPSSHERSSYDKKSEGICAQRGDPCTQFCAGWYQTSACEPRQPVIVPKPVAACPIPRIFH